MNLSLWQSIPFALVLLPLGSAAVTSALPKKAARVWVLMVLAVQTALSALLIARLTVFQDSYTYMMGHYPAPWGNEIRAGLLEAVVGFAFALVMLLSVFGGLKRLDEQLLGDRHSLMGALLLLLSAALQAQVYTNDLFTAYVFVEIMTIAAAALIAAHGAGRALVAATRYMVMNLVGSALFLLSIILLYDLTGQLLMSPLKEGVAALHSSGDYHLPLTVVVALMCTGLAVKSALFPFHTWVPDAYGTATPAAAAILSSLVSKGYIFLLVKLVWRVIGPGVIAATRVDNLLLVFGIAGMLFGSVDAIRQKDVKRMIAYSSVAQIGYIFMGIGLGTEAGLTAALFHLLSHAAAKAMLFLSADSLAAVSGGSDRAQLQGSGRRAPLAGIAFTIGALSMVGMPFLGGFVAKVSFAEAGIALGGVRMWLVLGALALSTALNVIYFLGTVIQIYRTPSADDPAPSAGSGRCRELGLIAFSLVNIALGLGAVPVLRLLREGLRVFG